MAESLLVFSQVWSDPGTPGHVGLGLMSGCAGRGDPMMLTIMSEGGN